MQIKFDSQLEYQQKAIDSVINLFLGQEIATSRFGISTNYRPKNNQALLFSNDEIMAVSNNLSIDDDTMLKNLKSVQNSNSLDISNELLEKAFSIEMETGTGKTYVYLRTIFELNKKYGFLKFIIIVPSIAIREGVKSSLKIMKEHFNILYDNLPFSYFVYDSSRLNEIKTFATDNRMQIMIINIQSFQIDDNIINREDDRTGGNKPIEFIQKTNPIVIIDEPQSVSSINSKKAIAKLNPLITLGYSATHKEINNLIYKLSPFDAYEQSLVKSISVLSIKEENNFNDAYVRLLKLDNSKGIKAYVEINQKSLNGNIKYHKLWLKQGDNLYIKSKKHNVYINDYIINAIDCTSDKEYIQFRNGKILRLNEKIGASDDEIMKEQIKATIIEHLEKEKELKENNIKVLSLFFIDEVVNYRIYKEGGEICLGKIGKWFEEIYKEEYERLIKENPNSLAHLKNFDINKLHGGYFSQDKKRNFKNTNGTTKDDENTYRLIMSDKIKLLDPLNPLRFIFSHSALKEGWDNPNVFQICILREVKSEIARRQQIGRGLRLAVDSEGNRINDSNINCLSVIIANESYEDFAKNLQEEFKKDGFEFNTNQIKDKKDEKILKLNEKVFDSDDFKDLWEKISQRTKYKIEFETQELIKKSVEYLKNSFEEKKFDSLFKKTVNKIKSINKDGTIDSIQTEDRDIINETKSYNLPDIVTHLQEKTRLSRKTICNILKESYSYEYFKKNPQLFMIIAEEEIKAAMEELIFEYEKIKYEKIDSRWNIQKIKESNNKKIYPRLFYEVENIDKSLFNFIECDSDIEKSYSKKLDHLEDVKLFFKLPQWFSITTPLGSYNPDWALIKKPKGEPKKEEVIETKGVKNKNDLRPKEAKKLSCGKKHFDAIGVEFREDFIKKN